MPFKCKDCGVPMFKRGDAFSHETRAAPAAGAAPYAGEKRRAGETTQVPPAPPGQKPPSREHFLTRPLFRKKEAAK